MEILCDSVPMFHDIQSCYRWKFSAPLQRCFCISTSTSTSFPNKPDKEGYLIQRIVISCWKLYLQWIKHFDWSSGPSVVMVNDNGWKWNVSSMKKILWLIKWSKCCYGQWMTIVIDQSKIVKGIVINKTHKVIELATYQVEFWTIGTQCNRASLLSSLHAQLADW